MAVNLTRAPGLSFLSRQVDQVKAGGWPALRRKLNLALPLVARFPIAVLGYALAVPITLIIRAIRPFCLVRVERIVSWRLGHFAGNLELYLCERDAGINAARQRVFDLWYHGTAPCNAQLATMFGRVIHIGPRWLLAPVTSVNALLPGGAPHHVGTNTKHDRDVHNLIERFSPHLSFTPEEEARGEAGLRALGIPPGHPFVCLAVRDAAYLTDQSSRDHQQVDWSYHDYRNCHIQNYVAAAQALGQRGYYVVRMGALVQQPMPVSDPMILDYAANGMRSEFMDIYLGAKCAFCISNGGGFDAVPYIFRRPVLYVDMVALGYSFTFSPLALLTTKKHWLRAEERFLTFRELFQSGAGEFFRSDQFQKMGIDLIESTPEEVAATVLEMEARLSGTWEATDADQERQRRFWELFPKTDFHGAIRAQVGTDFLRRNETWLE